MNKGIIFDIKKYAIHDGPGIRTTIFLKGCPLECKWCHNPESQKKTPELMVFNQKCLDECSECVKACKENALEKKEILEINRDRCTVCGDCVKKCPTGALKIIGSEISVTELIKEIEKDIIFYDTSSGGVTFSGGEPLYQANFLNKILSECKKREISTAIDTCGYTDFKNLKKISDKVDIFLYDIKTIDEKIHKQYTGKSNRIILNNLIELSKIHNNIQIRIPLIPGVTDTKKNINQIIEFLSKIDNIKFVSLLEYHKIGKDKNKRLGKKDYFYKEDTISKKKILEIKNKFKKSNYRVTIGG